MGKIFQYSDIKANRVPTKNDFLAAKTQVLETMDDLHNRGLVFGAKVYGSVAHGTPNVRSDFDLVVITQNDCSLNLLDEIFIGIKNNFHVGVEPLVISREFAQRGFHTIDSFFLRSIGEIPSVGNIAGFDPMEILKPHDLDPTKVHEQYLAQKIRKLQQGIFSNDKEVKFKTLQRSLEAPINVGRRTLEVLTYMHDQPQMMDTRKSEIARVFRKTFGPTNLAFSFDSLFLKDQEYSKLLESTLDSRVSKEVYEAHVNNLIKSAIPEALRWTSDLSRVYLNVLEGSQVSKEGQNKSYRLSKER